MADNRIDLAIHSAKDMPTHLPDGFLTQSVGPREDPRDVLLGCRWEDLPQQAIVGTSSLRRIAQLHRLRPDLICIPIRGNLQTRLRKMQQGQCQALMLAAAGVHRLAVLNPDIWANAITTYFDPVSQIIPAVGQGILAAEYLSPHLKMILDPLTNPIVNTEWLAERAFLRTLEGGCQVAIGGHVVGETLHGIWFQADDSFVTGTITLGGDPEQAGKQLALNLKQAGNL